jgi:hypothetical protein
VSGRAGAAEVHGNGTLSASGNAFTGRVDVHGNGDLDDQGGNSFQ